MDIVIFLLALIGFLVLGIFLFIIGRMISVTYRMWKFARRYNETVRVYELKRNKTDE